MEKQRIYRLPDRKLLITDGNLPRTYGLKIHKQNYSLRIIIYCIDSSLYIYSLISYLHEIIHNSIPKHFSHIKNSYHLVQ